MGEHDQFPGRIPGEIVEVYRRPVSWMGRVPGEIVEVYRQPDRREVVERYSRALPKAHPRAGSVRLLGDREPSRRPQPPLSREALLADLMPPPPPESADASGAAVPLRQKRRRHKGLLAFVFCVAVALGVTLAVSLFGERSTDPSLRRDPFEHFGWDGESAGSQPEEITIPAWPLGGSAALTVLQEHGEALTAQEVYRQVNPSVVTVMVDIDRLHMSVGTGVIFTEDGYFVTNYHVVAGGRDCTVMLDTGQSCDARYVAGDEDNDLAILKIAPADIQELGPLPPASFGDSDLLTVGDPVYAIGNPLGWELRGTLTDGIVSAINRDVDVDGRMMTLIQTNAALNSGNSGGPLINQYGQVVGINVIKMSSDYSTVEGLGFAIPSALMERMVNDLLEWGEIQAEPALGVTVRVTAEELEDGLRGLEVLSVVKDSAAERAGLMEGDFIVRADGEDLDTSQDLLRIRRRFYVGDELALTVWRNGERIDVSLELLETAD